ncbi:amino acid aminotransferase [Pontiella agarivorans]|uniref:Aspartate/tyrosine/aromatic aminotransferase n=1 Tax=Pontiella agarivorans TaxID=3038953 RepID=A0ABU5MWS8_9BACT|nr:amino acid aminotransferase [Pontiella agarivorans]MDZ8118673.1 aspartate/tyrosine/aromatic aminotransferase [Pontiella agarivorans]
MWKEIEAAPADAILGLTEAFKKDKNPGKVNLGVGVFKDDAGTTPILNCIKTAEKKLVETETTKGYLPIPGNPAYGAGVQKLLFGADSEVIRSNRAATLHTPGGTGALRTGADLLKKFKPAAKVWVSTPTWANHKGIFTAAGYEIADYPYYNAETKGVKYDELIETLEGVPAGDVVLMHVCCHNPTGVDLVGEQWDKVVEIAKAKGWTPFLDFAYQGFGDSIEEDRAAVEKFAAAGIDFVVASSFSKNFGLYNERTGAFTIVTPSAEETAVALSHAKLTVRVNYSNPPAHGGLAALTVLADDALYEQWIDEVAGMRDRIKAMRAKLVDGLVARGVEQDFSYIKEQRGMFSFSGLSDDIVEWLKVNKSIYIVKGGRINVAGLTSKNIDYVCDAIAEALKA